MFEDEEVFNVVLLYERIVYLYDEVFINILKFIGFEYNIYCEDLKLRIWVVCYSFFFYVIRGIWYLREEKCFYGNSDFDRDGFGVIC